MTTEVLLHLDHTLDTSQQARLEESLQSYANKAHIEDHSCRSELLFVSYDHDKTAPHDLVAAASMAGVTAHVVDF